MSEMIDAKPGSQEARIDAALSNNNGVITDQENNIEVRYNLLPSKWTQMVSPLTCIWEVLLFESAMTQTIWTGFSVVFHSPFSPVPTYYPKLGHSNSHEHSFEFFFRYHSTIQVCIVKIRGSVIK